MPVPAALIGVPHDAPMSSPEWYAVAPVIGIGAVAEAAGDRPRHRPDERAVTQRGAVAGRLHALGDALATPPASSASASSCCATAAPSAAFSACSAAAARVAGAAPAARRARRAAPSRRRPRRAPRRPSCFCCGDRRRCCASSCALSLVTRRGVVLALVADALEVVLALDQLDRSRRRSRAARSSRRRRRAGRAAPRCGARRRAPHASFFWVASAFTCSASAVEAEPVDGRPARRPAGRWPRRGGCVTSASAAVESLPLGLGVDQLAPAAASSAALASLTCCWSCCCLSVCWASGARRTRATGGEGHEEQRGQGPEPTHSARCVNNISHNSNSDHTS